MDDRCERPHAAPDEVRRRVARDRLDVVADELHVPVGVEVAPVHGARDVRQQGPEPFLAVAQVLQGLHALGDVDQESLSDRVAALVSDEHRLVEHPDERAVVPLQPILHAEGLERLASASELSQDAIAVVGMDLLGDMEELPIGAPLRVTQDPLQRRADMARLPVGADGVHRQGESLVDLRAGLVPRGGGLSGCPLGARMGRRTRHNLGIDWAAVRLKPVFQAGASDRTTERWPPLPRRPVGLAEATGFEPVRGGLGP